MHVRTLGGLTIDGAPGEDPPPAMGPRRLAMLAVLAAGGSRGVTRDRLIGILWPETDEGQARHALSQALYLLRTETGRSWVAGGTVLRLHESITSDAAQFQDALDANQLERAASLYAGVFLDGFHLPGAPGFEEWVESTRARLQSSALRALETLARQADANGRFTEAVGWWRRLGDIDPFSATYAAGRLRSLLAAGDQPAALRFAGEYEALVRREFDSGPAPVVAELTARLPHVDPPQPAPAAPAASPPAPPAAAAEAATTPVPGTPPARTARRRFALRAAAAIFALALVAAVAATMNRARSSPARPSLAIGNIQAPDTAPLGPLLRDMLATNLGRFDGVQVVANSRLVELLGRGSFGVPGAVADAARRAGVREIIEGEVTVTADGLLLTLRRVALESGLVRRGYTVRAADAYRLTDSATAAIARDLELDAPPDGTPGVRTRSAIAYALFEQGLRAKYEGDGPGVHRLMTAALERDPTFAMAAFHAWSYGPQDEADRLLPIVKRLAATAVDRERLFIQASLAKDEVPLPEFLGLARELAYRYPGDPDAQMLLGNAMWGAGDWADGVAAFNRAVAIDSAAGAIQGPYCRACGALHTMAQVYLWWDSAGAAERAARRIIAFRPDHPSGWEATVEPLLRQGRRAEAEASIARATSLSGVRPNTDWLLHRDLIRSGRLDEFEARLVSRMRSEAPTAWGEGLWLFAFVLRNQGRLREADVLARTGAVPGIGTRVDDYRDLTTQAIVALERGQARESARLFLDGVAQVREGLEPLGRKSRNTAWHMTLAGTALAEAGDTAAVRALADSVERVGSTSSFGRDPRLHFFLRGLLLQRENRHADAVDAFRRSLFSVTDGYTRTNLEMARSLMALQRHAEAIAILQPALRGGIDGSNTYVTHTELHEALARAFTGAGQRDSAATHWAAVERAWRRADPQFLERYRFAREQAPPAN